MDGEQVDALIGKHGAEIAQSPRIQGLTETDFGGQRQGGMAPGAAGHAPDPLGLVHETAAAHGAANQRRRTAEVEIHRIGSQPVQRRKGTGILLLSPVSSSW